MYESYENERIMAGIDRGLEFNRTLKDLMKAALENGFTQVSFDGSVTIGLSIEKQFPNGERQTGKRYLPDIAEELPDALAYAAAFGGEITVYFERTNAPKGSTEPLEAFVTLEHMDVVSWSNVDWLAFLI